MHWILPGAPFDAMARWVENPALGTVQVIPGAFSRAACKQILALGAAAGSAQAGVEKGDASYRRSRVTWLHPSVESAVFYHRVGLLLYQANQRYCFQLSGLVEPLQIAHYGVGDRFDWHTDLGLRETAGRKLSLTLQLSDSEDYEGGDLEFIGIHAKKPARALGTVLIFPSFLAHRVTEVTRGVRMSVVAWAYGSSFS